MTLSQRIRDLEHATIRPLGEFPEHCGMCAFWAETRRLQETCVHPKDALSTVDITAMGDPRQRLLVTCRRCGKDVSSESDI